MAHIELRGQPRCQQLIVNGVDLSMDTFAGVELVEVGDDPEFAQVGLRITLAVTRLDLDTEGDVTITDQFPSVAQRVRAMQKADGDE